MNANTEVIFWLIALSVYKNININEGFFQSFFLSKKANKKWKMFNFL